MANEAMMWQDITYIFKAKLAIPSQIPQFVSKTKQFSSFNVAGYHLHF
jgi:hypothetical protein